MKPRSRLLLPLLEPQWSPILFAVALLIFAIAGNALYDTLKETIGSVFGILVTGLIALAILAAFYWGRRALVKPIIDGREVSPRQALIVLVSQGELDNIPASTALQHHLGADAESRRLAYCCFISGPQAADPEKEPPTSSWSNATKLRAKCENLRVRAEVIPVDIESCQDSMRGCDDAWRRARRLRIPAREIVADVTGGTKQMSIGMSLACSQNGCEMEYLYPKAKLADGRADPNGGSIPRSISLRFFLRWPGEGES